MSEDPSGIDILVFFAGLMVVYGLLKGLDALVEAWREWRSSKKR